MSCAQLLRTIAAHNPCCCALQVQERAVPSLIAAASPAAAAAAVVRTYQAPAAGPLLLQYRVRQGPDCQGFPPRPHWSDAPVRVTSALLCSAKITAHPVWLLQGQTGLNLSSDDRHFESEFPHQSRSQFCFSMCLTFFM